jgi:hypothetical protein
MLLLLSLDRMVCLMRSRTIILRLVVLQVLWRQSVCIDEERCEIAAVYVMLAAITRRISLARAEEEKCLAAVC